MPVFEGSECFNEMLDQVLELIGVPKKVNYKSVENNLYKIAHNGSAFDSFYVMKNLPQLRSFVNFNKNGAEIVSLKIFIAYVDENKKFPKKFE